MSDWWEVTAEKAWPPKPIDPATISANDREALDVRLDTMASSLARDIDFAVEGATKEGIEIGPDLWVEPCCNMSLRVAQNWIRCIQQARAMLQSEPTTCEKLKLAAMNLVNTLARKGIAKIPRTTP